MGTLVDKSLILNRVKEFYGLAGNSELARFLGVAPNTITNWYNRNSIDYDLVITKCEGLDMNWLLTGKSHMSKVDSNKSNICEPETQYNTKEHILLLKEAIIDKDKIIEEKTRTIQTLMDAIKSLTVGDRLNNNTKGGHLAG